MQNPRDKVIITCAAWCAGRTNAAMVDKARNIVEMLGGQAMSATEARSHLGLADAGRTTRNAA